MSSARIALIVGVVGLFASAALSAMDFDIGGTLDNYSSLPVTVAPGSAILAPDQRDKVGVWADMHFGPDVSITGAASYDFTLEVPLLINLDYLKLDARLAPRSRMTLGRFTFTDFTGYVLNHTLDGALLEWSFPEGLISAAVGYSGLQLKPVSLILMSRSDNADQTNSSVFFAAPRLVEKLEALITGPTNVNLSLILQQDLRSSSTLIQPGEQYENTTSGGALNTAYLGFGFSGGITSSLYYTAYLYGNIGSTLSYVPDSVSITGFSYQYRPIEAFLGGFGLKYYIEQALSSRLELHAVFSSGDADSTSYLEGNTAGPSTMFVPISQEVIGVAFMPQLGNLVMLDLSYSFKPLARSASVWKNLELVAKVLSYLRPTTGAISQPGLDPSSTALYLGTEPEIIVNFRPYSDLGIRFSAGVFLPYGGAFTGTAASPTIGGRIEFSVSF